MALLLGIGELHDEEQLRFELAPRPAHHQDVMVILQELAAYDHLLEAV